MVGRSWSDLSDDEAQAVFDSYMVNHDGYVRRFLDERTAGRGRDRGLLDLTYGSLRPAWVWHQDDFRIPRRRFGRGGPPSVETWVDDGPYWAAMHASLVEPIGLEGCWQINDLAAYLLETVRRERSDAAWSLDKDERGGDYNQPVLQVAGQTALRATQVLLLSRRAVGLKGPKRVPDPIDGLYGLVSHLDGVADDGPEAEPAVELMIDGGEVIVSFSDAVAHERSAALDGLVEHLVTRSGIVSVERSDREVLVVRTALGPDSIERMITRYLQL